MKQLIILVLATHLAGAASLVIDGQSNKTYDGGSYSNCSIRNSTGITVKNAKFAGTGSVISIDGSSNIVVDNCEADGLGNACIGVNIKGASHHIMVKNCDIHNIADDGFQLRGTNLNNITIQGNKIHKLLGKGTDGVIPGPCYNGHSDGIETANTDKVHIIGNILYDIQSTSAIIVGDDTNMKIHNNIIHTKSTLIGVYHHNQNNTEIYHNTIWGAEFSGLAIGKGVYGLKAYNNIIQKIEFQTLGGSYDKGQMSIDYNLLSQVGVGYTWGANDKFFPAQSFTNNPNAYTAQASRPTDVVMEDFGLLSTCPGINAGKTGLGISSDILGNPRDGQPDMGAIEYQGTAVRELVEKDPDALFADMPYPNPMISSVTFPLNGNIKAVEKRLIIRSQNGSVVKSWSSSAPMEYLAWDGRDESGRQVWPGLYFYSYTIDRKTTSGTLFKTR